MTLGVPPLSALRGLWRDKPGLPYRVVNGTIESVVAEKHRPGVSRGGVVRKGFDKTQQSLMLKEVPTVGMLGGSNDVYTDTASSCTRCACGGELDGCGSDGGSGRGTCRHHYRWRPSPCRRALVPLHRRNARARIRSLAAALNCSRHPFVRKNLTFIPFCIILFAGFSYGSGVPL